MQRTGRKGHANFRVIVQDSRQAPTSGKVVALLGSYDPHAKTSVLDKEKAQRFLDNGAQPSERVALLLKKEGVKLPDWVKINTKKSKELRNPEKLRKNRPADAEPTESAPAEPAAQPDATAEAASSEPAAAADVVEEAKETPQAGEPEPKTEEASPEAEA